MCLVGQRATGCRARRQGKSGFLSFFLFCSRITSDENNTQYIRVYIVYISRAQHNAHIYARESEFYVFFLAKRPKNIFGFSRGPAHQYHQQQVSRRPRQHDNNTIEPIGPQHFCGWSGCDILLKFVIIINYNIILLVNRTECTVPKDSGLLTYKSCTFSAPTLARPTQSVRVARIRHGPRRNNAQPTESGSPCTVVFIFHFRGGSFSLSLAHDQISHKSYASLAHKMININRSSRTPKMNITCLLRAHYQYNNNTILCICSLYLQRLQPIYGRASEIFNRSRFSFRTRTT